MRLGSSLSCLASQENQTIHASKRRSKSAVLRSSTKNLHRATDLHNHRAPSHGRMEWHHLSAGRFHIPSSRNNDGLYEKTAWMNFEVSSERRGERLGVVNGPK